MPSSITTQTREEWLLLRAKNINSTEVAALFGLSPYTTAFELYHRKRDGAVTSIDENERMKWGKRLEPVIAAGIAQDNMLALRAMPEYIQDETLRMGSSFDYRILDIATKQLAAGEKEINAADSPEDGIFEVKNVDNLAYRDGWAEDDNGVEAPPHIELQVQHQLLLSGLKYAKIGALVGGNKPVIITRVRDEGIIEQIKTRVAQFWAAVDLGAEPKPDFSKDADFIRQLHSFAEPGKEIDLSGDASLLALVSSYRDLGKAAKEAEEKRKAIKAEILIKIGDAEKAFGAGFSVSAGLIGPKHVEYDADGYRDFRVNWKKEKRA